MCFHVASNSKIEEIENKFKKKFTEPQKKITYYHVSGFNYPLLPVISSKNPYQISLFNWGLIPFWCKSQVQTQSIKNNTLNAKCETIFEKPSFKYLIKTKRCLVIVDGFFEWQHTNTSKIPYFIQLKNNAMFALGAVYDEWINPDTQNINHTFSIITTPANQLITTIHNTKQRMPLIIDIENYSDWLDEKLPEPTIINLMKPYLDNKLQAHQVNPKIIGNKNKSSNIPSVQAEFTNNNLFSKQLFLL